MDLRQAEALAASRGLWAARVGAWCLVGRPGEPYLARGGTWEEMLGLAEAALEAERKSPPPEPVQGDLFG